MDTRLMLSTPPATTSCSKPLATLAAARLTLSSPEAQKRDCVTPPTDCDQPASSTAMRAMSPPCSPMGVTQPRTTSSTRAVSSWVRCCRACSTLRTSQIGVAACSDPSGLPLPRGVRQWS